MRVVFRILTLLSILFVFIPVSVEAADTSSPTERVLERVFDEAERAIIEEYFGKKDIGIHSDKKSKNKGKSKSTPPGLAKRETLPPGLAKQLEKNRTLPPGLAKRDLPDDLLERLPPAKKGTKRIVAGKDVVLVEMGTDIVLDIIKDIISE